MSKQEVCTVSRKIIIDDFSLSKVYSQQLSLTQLQPWMLQNCWFLKSGLGHRRKNEKKKKHFCESKEIRGAGTESWGPRKTNILSLIHQPCFIVQQCR